MCYDSLAAYTICLKVVINMPVSQAQQRAVNKYLRNNFDDIKTRVTKGKREEYKNKAKALGYESFNNFVIAAIEEKIERESAGQNREIR